MAIVGVRPYVGPNVLPPIDPFLSSDGTSSVQSDNVCATLTKAPHAKVGL